MSTNSHASDRRTSYRSVRWAGRQQVLSARERSLERRPLLFRRRRLPPPLAPSPPDCWRAPGCRRHRLQLPPDGFQPATERPTGQLTNWPTHCKQTINRTRRIASAKVAATEQKIVARRVSKSTAVESLERQPAGRITKTKAEREEQQGEEAPTSVGHAPNVRQPQQLRYRSSSSWVRFCRKSPPAAAAVGS